MPRTETHRLLRLGSRLLPLVLTLPVAASGNEIPWVVYYSDQAGINTFNPYRLVILDSDRHPPVRLLTARGKTVLGYISAGEVESRRAYFDAVRAEGILLQENKNWPGSFFVDVRDSRWRRRVVDELVPAVLGAGFGGVFLDTLDNPPYLEETEPRKYRGMSDAAAALVAAIRARYPAIKLAMNRGYAILPRVEQHLDYVLGESVRADYDFETKKYRRVPEPLYLEQVRILQGAKKRRPQLQILTLDYWNPVDRAGVARIYREQRARGFHPYVATVELDRIVPEPRP